MLTQSARPGGAEMLQMKQGIMGKSITLILTISFVFSVLLCASCSEEEVINEKVDSQLLTQVNLRKAQIADPTSDRLEMMQNLGMRVDNLEIHRIFIHLRQELNISRIDELGSMGIILYLDSWIPPVGAHPTGYIIADMPIDKLGELADRDYVVKLDTAERELEPQNGIKPQSE